MRELLRGSRDGEIDRVRRIVELDGDAIGPAGRDAPRVFVGAVPIQRLAARILRAEAVDVARIVLDFVIARTPCRQRDEERVLAGGGKLGADVERRTSDGDFITNGLRRN